MIEQQGQADDPSPDTTTASAGTASSSGVVATSGQQSIAETLAQLSSRSLRFFHGIGWHHWDDLRWAPDTDGTARRQLLRAIHARRRTAGNNEQRKADIKAVMSSSGQKGALEIASILPEFAFSAATMDANPKQLNVANGTLDLDTFELNQHEQDDNITKVTRAAFDPDADASLWVQFLERVLPDPEVRSYIQRYIGLSLLGTVREHILAIVTGTGANGKTTFYEAIMFALGDYAHTAESDLLMKAKANANAASPAIMALMGKRFVVMSETEDEAPLAVALMKNLTGGDPITTRGLFKDPVTFLPSHTALMVTNFKPKVPAKDEALWRRLTIIDFDVVIPEDERDPMLSERLQLSADAILVWAVEGLKDYLDQGLNPPAAVRRSTQSYRVQSDDMGRFIDSQIDVSPNAFTTRAQVWDRWQQWANEAGVSHGKSADFYANLETRGYISAKVQGVRGFKGMTLAKDTADVDDDVFTDTKE